MQSTPAKTDSGLSWNPQTNDQTQRLHLSKSLKQEILQMALKRPPKGHLQSPAKNIPMVNGYIFLSRLMRAFNKVQ